MATTFTLKRFSITITPGAKEVEAVKEAATNASASMPTSVTVPATTTTVPKTPKMPMNPALKKGLIVGGVALAAGGLLYNAGKKKGAKEQQKSYSIKRKNV